ncbi:hypothetical protein RA210_U340006 [Rubrivivax sp. A210]|nr:hypothetical protein RA210_U340006 [Rubrivivax sp. A210]
MNSQIRSFKPAPPCSSKTSRPSSSSTGFACFLPRMRPNPSLNRTSYGRPPWPELRYAVHFLSSGQGALPPPAG